MVGWMDGEGLDGEVFLFGEKSWVSKTVWGWCVPNLPPQLMRDDYG
jgi:hypothetical protein